MISVVISLPTSTAPSSRGYFISVLSFPFLIDYLYFGILAWQYECKCACIALRIFQAAPG